MQVIPTTIPEVTILQPRVFTDARGYFMETYTEKKFKETTGLTINFIQENESASVHGVIRGLHYQRPPYAQNKLVRCFSGRVLGVALDIRKDSPTYGKYVQAELSEHNHCHMFIPEGFAFGYAVLSPKSVILERCDTLYNPDAVDGIYPFDPTLAIDWQISADDAIVSDKDSTLPMLKDIVSPF